MVCNFLSIALHGYNCKVIRPYYKKAHEIRHATDLHFQSYHLHIEMFTTIFLVVTKPFPVGDLRLRTRKIMGSDQARPGVATLGSFIASSLEFLVGHPNRKAAFESLSSLSPAHTAGSYLKNLKLLLMCKMIFDQMCMVSLSKVNRVTSKQLHSPKSRNAYIAVWPLVQPQSTKFPVHLIIMLYHVYMWKNKPTNLIIGTLPSR